MKSAWTSAATRRNASPCSDPASAQRSPARRQAAMKAVIDSAGRRSARPCPSFAAVSRRQPSKPARAAIDGRRAGGSAATTEASA